MRRTPFALSAFLGFTLAACDLHRGEPEPEPEPAPLPRTVDVVLAEAGFDAFAALLGDAGLDDLRGRDGVTLFAPDNAAVGQIPGGCRTLWTLDGRMIDAIRHHIVLGDAELSRATLTEVAADAPPANELFMETFESVVVEGGDLDLRVDGQAIGARLEAANGVIHPVSGQMLLPAALRASLAGGCVD